MSWHNKDPRQMLKSQIILSSHLELLLLMPKNRKLFVDLTQRCDVIFDPQDSWADKDYLQEKSNGKTLGTGVVPIKGSPIIKLAYIWNDQ